MRRTLTTGLMIVMLAVIPIGILSAYELSYSFDESADSEYVLGQLAIGDSELLIEEARWFVYLNGEDKPSFLEFSEVDGMMIVPVPRELLEIQEELVWFVELKDTEGAFIRVPESGEIKTISQEILPPSPIELLFPVDQPLETGRQQVVIFDLKKQYQTEQVSVLADDELLEPMIKGSLMQIIVSPEMNETSMLGISLQIGDQEPVSYEISLVEIDKELWYSGSVMAYADIEHTFSGEQVSGSLLEAQQKVTEYDQWEQEHESSLATGFEAAAAAGPLALEVQVEMAYSGDPLMFDEVMLDTLAADLQDILSLINPWDFDTEFSFDEQRVRKYGQENTFLVSFSLWDDLFNYRFGDQQIHFQDISIKDLSFRGSSISLETPLLWFKAGKGLTDLGLYESAYPQNLFALQLGLGSQELIFLQTNISMISDFMGRYDDIGTDSGNLVIDRFSLDDVKAEENFVLGIGTGLDTDWLKVSADAGLTLYVDDMANRLNLANLLTQLEDGFDLDTSVVDPYLDIMQDVYAIFPYLDYFPLSVGLGASAINRDLWGLMYDVNISLPVLGIDLFYLKSDASYKSLGASVSSDIMTYGASLDQSLAGFDISAVYTFEADAVPNILMHEILPLTGLLDVAEAVPTEADISQHVQTISGDLTLPGIGLLGRLKLGYEYESSKTNADELTVPETSETAEHTLVASTKNTAYVLHTGGVSWTSGSLDIAGLSLSADGAFEMGLKQYSLMEGVEDDSSERTYEAECGVSAGLFNIGIDAGYQRAWNGQDKVIEHQMSAGLDLPILNTSSISGEYGFTQDASVCTKRTYEAALDLGMAIGSFEISAEAAGSFTDDLLDDAEDEVSVEFSVSGGISL